MKIAIDPPAKRSLTPNEQKVYRLLQEGLEPLETARKIHMPLKVSNLANRHDVPPDTVMGLIASIREKGWEIPNNSKEDNIMARGQSTPVEKVHEISVLKNEGKTQQQIAEITGIPLSTVGKICVRLGKAETKEEPAPSANGTSSSKEENIFTSNIVAENPADVKPAEKISENAVKSIPEAVAEACIEKRNALQGELEDIREQIREIDEFLGTGVRE